MNELHRLLAEVALALSALATGWAVVLLATRRAPGRLFAVNLGWVVVVAGVAALVGVLMALAGPGPRDPLHLVYGVLAVGAVPGAFVVALGRSLRQQTAVWTVAALVMAILVLRLFQTGT